MCSSDLESRLYRQPKPFELTSPTENRGEIQEWVDTIVRRIELQENWQSLSSYIQQKKAIQPVEPQPETTIDKAAPSVQPQWETVIDGVLADLVSHQSTAMLGPVLVGLSAWNQLDMDGCLKGDRKSVV